MEYYRAVAAGLLLTALRDRPTHLQRFPDGIEGEEIYQKRVPEKHPDYLHTCRVTFHPGRTADALKVTHPSAIAWAAQMGTVTFHPWQVRCPDTDHPTTARRPRPAAGNGIRRGPHRRRRRPRRCWTSRSGRLPEDPLRPGVHVFLRIRPDWDFVAVRRAGIALAREIERRAPDLVTTSGGRSSVASGSSSTTTRTPATAPSPRPTRCVPP